jgi:hypothetical protein
MDESRRARLSKSKYLAGLQCARRLWLQVHRRGLADEPDAGARAAFAAGTEVGQRAQQLFAGGVRVSEPAWQHGRAVEQTRALLADSSVPAIFEAAFEHLGVRVRVDVLERLTGARFGLCEVKSSTRLKPVHLDDLALQSFVVEGAGVPLGPIELLRVNRAYVRGDSGLDWSRYFAREDCTGPVRRRHQAVEPLVEGMQALLRLEAAPRVAPGFHCRNPHPCEFWSHCTADAPADWIFHLPRLRRSQYDALCRAGCRRIARIPDGAALTPLQLRARDALRSGQPWVSTGLGEALEPLEPPTWYLDFETVSPAIPLFPGTRPYEPLPFQWSLHRLAQDGGVEHRAFLAEARGDPRRAFAEQLVSALGGDENPVVVYSAYEHGSLQRLSASLPDLAPSLGAIMRRLVDLLPVVRTHVYHPGFAGSFSLKRVAPSLAPAVGYADLGEVADGAAASAAFARLARGEVQGAAAKALRADLLRYCERDTRALLELHRALRSLHAARRAS